MNRLVPWGAVQVELAPLPTRIFGIGLQRTATTSLHRAFQILGFDSFHWGTGEVPRIWAEMNTEGRSTMLERHYAFSDNPFPLLYRQLDKAYPGSKFVLTVRGERDWIKSMERLWSYEHNPTRGVWDKWPITNCIHHALYGRTDFDAETMLAAYRRHNAEVIDHFRYRSDDLLILRIDEAARWRQLCDFLGEPIPEVPYPRENWTAALE